MHECNMDDNYAVVGCIPNFSMNLIEFLKYIKIMFKSKNYDMIPEVNNIAVAIGLIGKLHDDSSVGFLLQIEKLVESFASRGINMILAKNIETLKFEDWELGNISKRRDKELEATSGHTYTNVQGFAVASFQKGILFIIL